MVRRRIIERDNLNHTWGGALAVGGFFYYGVHLLPQDAQPVVHLRPVAPDVQRVGGVADRVHQQRKGLPAQPSIVGNSERADLIGTCRLDAWKKAGNLFQI